MKETLRTIFGLVMLSAAVLIGGAIFGAGLIDMNQRFKRPPATPVVIQQQWAIRFDDHENRLQKLEQAAAPPAIDDAELTWERIDSGKIARGEQPPLPPPLAKLLPPNFTDAELQEAIELIEEKNRCEP